jgi:two-component SAPR family response regulator
MKSVPTILLLEDETLIALDVEQTMLGAGAKNIVHIKSCAAAISWLADHTPDIAILDIFLLDGECIDVADVLVERGVPFVVHSARRKATHESHQILLKGDWVSKPAHPAELIRAVDQSLKHLHDTRSLGCRDKIAMRPE